MTRKRDERTAVIILYFFIIGAVTVVYVVVQGVWSANADCKKSGGAYVKTFSGYKCMKEVSP